MEEKIRLAEHNIIYGVVLATWAPEVGWRVGPYYPRKWSLWVPLDLQGLGSFLGCGLHRVVPIEGTSRARCGPVMVAHHTRGVTGIPAIYLAVPT